MLVLQIHAKTHSELSMLPRVQIPCLCPPSMLNRVLHKSVRCLVRSDMPLQNGSSAETCRRCISGGVSEECVACLERLQQAAGNVWQHDHQLKVDNTAAHFWIHLKARCTPVDGEQCNNPGTLWVPCLHALHISCKGTKAFGFGHDSQRHLCCSI